MKFPGPNVSTRIFKKRKNNFEGYTGDVLLIDQLTSRSRNFINLLLINSLAPAWMYSK